MGTDAGGLHPGFAKLLLASLLVAAVPGTAAQAQQQPLAWSRRAPMPVPTSRAGSGAIDRTLVTLGGTVENADGTFTPTSLVQAYDADLDAWRFLSPLPEPRFAYAHAVLGGTVYLAGGYAGAPSFSLSGAVLAYDVDGPGAVRPVGQLLTPRFRTSAAILDGKLYVVGGGASGTTLASVEQVDLVTGVAVEMPPLPAPRQQPAVASFAGSLFVMGGHDASGASTDTCWTFRPPYGGWVSCAPLPFARSGAGAEVALGRILLAVNSLGGTPITGWSDQVLEYDPRTDAWTVRGVLGTVRRGAVGVIQDHLYVAGADDATGEPVTEAAALYVPPWPVLPLALRPRMPTPRGGGVAALVDGRIVAIAGTNRNDPPPSGALATVEALDLAANAWVPLPPIHEARFSAQGGAVGATVYLAAGSSPTGLRADVLGYDVRTGSSWIDGPLLEPRFRHDAAAIGSRIYVVGGYNGGALASAEAYDVNAHASVRIAPLPAPRDLPAVVAVDGVLYALGGYDAAGAHATDVWSYDPATDAWTARSPLPIAPGGAPATVAGGRIVVLGGTRDSGPAPGDVLGAVQVYDPAADAWSVLGALDTFRVRAMAAAAGDEVFLIGGHDDSLPLGLVESFTLSGGGAAPAAAIEWPADGAALSLHDVVLSGTAWDDGGLARVEVSTDGGATWAVAAGTTAWTYLWQPLGEGQHLLLARAVDAYGTVQNPPAAVSVVIDWTPPAATIALQPPRPGAGWWNVPVTASFDCTDALSGIASCPGPVLFSGEGAAQPITGTAWDRAGNAAVAEAWVSIDLTPPAIAASPSRPGNPAGWWNAPVTIAFACADGLSGIASCPEPVTVSTEGAGQLVSGAAADVAGNAASVSLLVNVDWTPPELAVQPTTPPNAAGWWNAPVTVAFGCGDALSGVASCPEATTVPYECAGCAVGGYAVDRADNGTYAETYVSVDMTPPQCAVGASGAIGPDGAYRSSAVVTVGATDTLSGVAAVEVDTGAGWVPYEGPLVVGASGTTVVSCRAIDVAGNEGFGTPLPITVALGGELVWTARAPMPVPTTRAASGVVDRTLYVLGGVAVGFTANVWAYDADVDGWRPMPPLPQARASAAVTTLGATIYLAGGTGSWMASSTVVAYDVDVGATRQLGTLLVPRIRAGAAVNAGKLYVVGGFGGAGASVVLDSVEEIDLVTGASLARPPLPAPRQAAGVASHGGYLYVMGGYDAAGQPTDTCWKTRLAYPSPWTACATLPYPRTGEALHGHGRILLGNNNVSAGLPPTAWTADVLAYDPATDAWAVLGQKATPVRGAALGVIQDALFAAGGTDGSAAVGATASAPLAPQEWPPLPWLLRAHAPSPRAGATVAVVDGRVVLLGGTNRNDTPPTGALATVEAYDPSTNAWATLPPLLEPRYQSPGGAVGSVAYLAGGTTPSLPTRSDVLAYDVRSGASWIDGQLLEPRFRHGAAVMNGKVYVAGGRGASALLTSVEAYDVATHGSTPLAPLPGTRDMARVVAAAGHLYVLGGYEAGPEPTMLEYDFANGAWVSLPPPPIASGSAPVIAVGRNVVVLGGAISGPAPSDTIDAVQLYDALARTWTVLGALDTFRYRPSAAFLGGAVYLVGGDDGAVPLSLAEAFTIDGTPPTSSIASPVDGSFTNERQLWVTGTAWDDFGIQGVDVADDGETWTRASGRSSWSWSWMPLAEGEHVLQSRAIDSSDNLQDPPARARVTVDWTPPGIAATPSAPANASGWWNAPVVVSFACGDALSGVESCPAPVTVSTETPAEGTEVAGAAADRAGNFATASLRVRLDRTAPACTLSAAGTTGLNGIYVSDVVVVVAASDALAGVAAVEVSTGAGWAPYAGPLTVSSEGASTVSCRATDLAGNAGEAELSFTIDRIAPAVLSTSPANGAVGVPVTSVVTVTFGEPVLAGPAWGQIQLLNGKKVVPITASISGAAVTLRPDVPLDRNRSYTVSLPGGAVTDRAGNAFAGAAGGTPYGWVFTTAK